MNNKSLFHYEKGLSYLHYSHPDFEPIFLDEVDRESLENAKAKCGYNSSQACIFDFLATGDIALAESSGTEEAAAQSDMKIIGETLHAFRNNYNYKTGILRHMSLYK